MGASVKLIIMASILLILKPSTDAASIISKIQGLDDDLNDSRNTLTSIEEGSSKNYEIGFELMPKIRRRRQADDFTTFIENIWKFDRICFEPSKLMKLQSTIPISSAQNYERLRRMFDLFMREFNKFAVLSFQNNDQNYFK
ncbi:unnamed protein product [Chironomus riparius]|uniref:Uncharacterized protein n=1 Tax=Chironomus riparius TaxID=315576 RepID=A0A9N9S6K9_9DIPT|nr:unnamed protein product [Chironomus riparius]